MSKCFPLAIVLCFTFSIIAPVTYHFESELGNEKVAHHSSSQDFEWLWGDIISGANYEFANAIATDSNGNLFVGGSFNGGYIEQNETLHYNAGTYGQYDSYTNDMFLAKYNSSGNLEWFQTYGESNSSETINGVAIAADGDIVICGSAKGNFSLGSHTVNYTYIDGLYDGVPILAGHWLAELNSTGQVNWVKSMENADICGGTGEHIGGLSSVLKISPNTGSIYTVGHSKMKNNIWGCQCNNSSFGGIIVENTNDDWDENGFVVKFDANGTFQWRYEIPGRNGSFKDLEIFSLGTTETVYTSGFLEFPGTGVDFPGTSITLTCNDCQKARDPFIATIEASNGQVNWATKASPVKSPASSYTYQSMNRISLDGMGNAILVGGFTGESMNFTNPSGNPIQINNSGGNDGYIAKINNTGYWQWAKQLGDLPSRSEWISDVDVDVYGNAIISGGFKAESLTIGNTTLSNSYSNNYDADLFIAAIDADGEWLWANSTQGTQYDNGDLVMFSGNTSGYVVGQTFGGISWGNNTDTSTYGSANQIFVGKFEFPKMIFDSDLDGVIDGDDLCPNTPPGVSVNQDGCSAAQLDEDGDGVGDYIDQCPNTPTGESVDFFGCSQSQLDDDGDGVMNDIDQCPNTPVGESVDAVGCSQSQLDDDGDGVMNDIDQCPNTPVGESVDAVGCSQSQLDDDGDGVMNDIDQCPNTPIGVNVGPNGCNSPPICTFYYDNSSGSQTIFIQDLPMGSGSQVASLSLVSGTYQFHVECNDQESDSIQMIVTFDGGPDNIFTGSPLVSGPLPVTLNDGMDLSKELTYVWTDGANSGTFDVIFSIEGDDNTGSDGSSFIPGFELQLVIFAIIFAFAMARKRI